MMQLSPISLSSLRAGFGAALIITTILITVPLQWISIRLGLPSERWIPIIFHRLCCKALGVRIKVNGKCADKAAVLITANHCSWIDIPVVGSIQPLSFIAKSEVSGWPIFGFLARLQHTIFVNRSKRSDTGNVALEIAQRLASGDAMVLFAEGTSSDGNRVLPFRTSLVGAAKAAMTADLGEGHEDIERPDTVWIQPLSIAYTGVQGLPMGRQHRHIAAWYGDMDLMPHLWAILKESALDVTLTFAEPIPFGPEDNRKKVAKKAEEAVREATNNVLLHRGDHLK